MFSRFKAYADYQAGQPMVELLQQIDRAATIYRNFTEKAEVLDGPLDRLGLFAYRMKTLESEVIKPVLLALLRPQGRSAAAGTGRCVARCAGKLAGASDADSCNREVL